jgi:hypothetical protein
MLLAEVDGQEYCEASGDKDKVGRFTLFDAQTKGESRIDLWWFTHGREVQ